MPDLCNENFFTDSIPVKVLFDSGCKWCLVEEFGIDSFDFYYTNGCPFTAKYVPILEKCAMEHGITLTTITIESREKAQNAPFAWTNFAVFYDGKYITNEILSEKKFLALSEQLEGEYKAAIGLLYGIAFTITMSYKGSHKIEGYFEYVVPPLEGLWWQKGIKEIDYSHKETFEWIAMIRLPEFVTRKEFDWAIQEATEKKKNRFF